MDPIVILLIIVISVIMFLLLLLCIRVFKNRAAPADKDSSSDKTIVKRKQQEDFDKNIKKTGKILTEKDKKRKEICTPTSDIRLPNSVKTLIEDSSTNQGIISNKDKHSTNRKMKKIDNDHNDLKKSVPVKSPEETREPIAQVRKRRVPDDNNSKQGENEPVFIFPDTSYCAYDPLASDKSINSQLDELLRDHSGDNKIPNEYDYESNIGTEDSALELTAEQSEVTEQLIDEQTTMLEDDPAETLPNSAAGQMIHSENLTEIEFSNLHFKHRSNKTFCLERLPREYKFHYVGETAQLVIYNDSVKLPQQDNTGRTMLFNSHVYSDNRPKRWDDIMEIRIHRGQTISVDFGVGVFLPEGYALQLIASPSLTEKFGLQLTGNTILGREEASNSIIVTFIACSDTSYIAKNQSLLSCKVVRVA